MRRASTVLKYVLAGAIVLILGGLSGWFFYLRSETSSTTALGNARGYDISTPLFGSPEGSTQSDIAQTLGQGAPQTNNSSSPLWRVDATPVAGFGFEKAATSTPGSDLYFAERGSGNIFQADFATRSVVRLTDTLMAKTYEAFFAPNGGVIERSVDDQGDITTFQGEIASTTAGDTTSTSTPEELIGTNMSSGIQDLSLNPVTGALAYLYPDTSGNTDLIEQPWTTGAKNKSKDIFSSVIGSWQIFALSDGRTVLLESPSDNLEGYAYTVSSSGALTQIASGPGLTIAPDPGTSALIFGTSAGGALTLFAQTSAKAAPITLAIATVADKCAWLLGQSMIAYCAVPASIPSQTFLDDWYRGTVHTTDSWYEIDATTGSTTLVYAPQPSDPPLDVQDPSMDPSGTYVVFLNGVDKSLWALNIVQ